MFGLLNFARDEIILILAIILIQSSAKKLPEIANGLGQGIREFGKATHDASEGLREAMVDNLTSTPRRLAPAIASSTAHESSYLPPEARD